MLLAVVVCCCYCGCVAAAAGCGLPAGAAAGVQVRNSQREKQTDERGQKCCLRNTRQTRKLSPRHNCLCPGDNLFVSGTTCLCPRDNLFVSVVSPRQLGPCHLEFPFVRQDNIRRGAVTAGSGQWGRSQSSERLRIISMRFESGP